jgi:hypothetical protein
MHALSFPQFFDSPLPATEQPHSHRRAAHARPVAPHRAGEGFLSIAKLHERLALLAKLELPCTIVVASPALHLREAVINTVGLVGDTLSIAGKGFALRLRGPNIHSIRLVSQREAEDGISRLDIHHSHGMLYASIQPAPDGAGGEVWQDVMDNPTLSLA